MSEEKEDQDAGTCKYTPRQFQNDAVDRMRERFKQGKKRLILQAACGSGKTVMACMVMQGVVAKKKSALFLAGARQLVLQCSRKLKDFGLHHGIIMAGYGYTRSSIQVASKDTLFSRVFRQESLELPAADLIIVDEQHLAGGESYRKILDAYPNAYMIGLSASPQKTSIFDEMICAVSSKELLRLGFLVPCRVWAPCNPNLKPKKGEKWRGSDGDYSEDFLNKRMDRPQLVGDIVSHWKRLGEDRQTVVFSCSRQHGQHIRDEFLAKGIRTEYMDGETIQSVRDEILGTDSSTGRFGDRTTRVIISCGVLNIGVDFPIASCGILARPTKSFRLFWQQVGRLKRPYPGKVDAHILDHAGNVIRHLHPDEDFDWSVTDDKKTPESVVEDLKEENKVIKPTVCPRCSTLFTGSKRCPSCGMEMVSKSRTEPKVVKEGLLQEYLTNPNSPSSREWVVRMWHKSLFIAAGKKLSMAAAAAMFKKETGLLPWTVTPQLPHLPDPRRYKDKVSDVFPQFVPGNRVSL